MNRQAALSSPLQPVEIIEPWPLADFRLRCWARAYLWACGMMELDEAVDELQAAAVRDGLIVEIGQGAVQEIMALEFSAFR